MITALVLASGLLAGTQAWAEGWLRSQYRQYRVFARLDRAYELIGKREYDRARRLLEEALLIDPVNERVRRQLIDVCLQVQDFNCVRNQAKFLASRSRTPETYLLLQARADLAQGRNQAVIDSLSSPRVLSRLKGADRETALRLMVRAYLNLKRPYDALGVLHQLRRPGFFELFSMASVYAQVDDLSASARLFEQLYPQAQTSQQRMEIVRQLVYLYLELHQYDKAGLVLGRLLSDCPDRAGDPDLTAMRIMVAIKLRQWAQARHLWRVIRQQGTIDPALAGHWAQLLADAGQYDFALEILQVLPYTWERTVREANLLELAGRYQEAAQRLQRYCWANSCLKKPWLRIATLYAKAGLFDRELDTLNRAVQAVPDNQDLFFHLVDRCVALGHFDQARRLLQARKRARSAESLDLDRRLIDLYVAMNRPGPAIRLLRKNMSGGSSMSPELVQQFINLMAELDPEQRIEAGQWLLQRLDKPSYFLLSSMLYALEQKGKWGEMLALLDRFAPFAHLSRPHQVDLMLGYAELTLKSGAMDRAIAILKEISAGPILSGEQRLRFVTLQAETGNCGEVRSLLAGMLLASHPPVRAWIVAGTCYSRAAMPGLAAWAYGRVVRSEPDCSSAPCRLALINLAYQYAETREYRQALAAFRRYHRLTGDQVAAVRAAAMALRLGNRTLAATLLEPVSLEELQPEVRAQAELVLGDLAAAARDGQRAEAHYRRGLEKEPSAVLWQHLAENRQDQGDLIGAEHPLLQALDMEPDNGSLAAQLAYLVLALGNDQKAAPLLERALRGLPDQLDLYRDLAYTRKRLGDNEEAIARFRQVVDRAPFAVCDSEEQCAADREELFRVRREIQEIGRRFLGTLGVAMQLSDNGNAVAASPIETPLNTGFGELLLAWQPPVVGYRNGKVMQAFSRLLWGSGSGSLAPEPDSYQLGLGVAVKPLSDWNLVLSGERFIGVGDLARDEWFLRARASIDSGLDWEPVRQEWPYLNLFVDSGWYLESGTGLASFEGRAGWNLRVLQEAMPAGVLPYVLAAGSWSNDNVARDDTFLAEIGLGLELWHWCNQTTYEAYRTKNRLSIELRQPVGGNTDRTTAIMLRLGTGF